MRDAELDPGMPAVDGFAVVLGRLSSAIDANWGRATDAADPEGLHDLRVALRRTRAVLRSGRRVLPSSTVDEATTVLRSLTAATGPARDLDVLAGGDAGRLGPVLAAVEAERERVRAELPAILDDPDVATWRRRWPDVVAAAPRSLEAGEHAHRRLGRVVARRLRRAQREVLAGGRGLDADTDAAAVHRLRKDARQLRYLLECFAELAPGREARFVEHLKAFQAVLGGHQDLVVQVALLRRLATSPDVDVLVDGLERAQEVARAAFADRFAAYDTNRDRRAFARLVDEVAARPR